MVIDTYIDTATDHVTKYQPTKKYIYGQLTGNT